MSVPRTAVRLLLAVLSIAAGALALLLSLVTPVFWVLAGLAAAATVVAALAPAGRTRPEPAAVPAAERDAATVLTV
jgi:hypothetical protein